MSRDWTEEVGLTALAVAAGRAVESSRPNPLVLDPYAKLLVEAAGAAVDFPTEWPESLDEISPAQQPLLLGSLYIGLRSRFVDDFLRSTDSFSQFVSLGAGLDARAYRLDWPAGSRVFELDHPGVLDFKSHVMAEAGVEPRCQLTLLAADLGERWDRILLSAPGFDPDQPTIWVVEGLLPYLSATSQQYVLDVIGSRSPVGSRAIIERAVPMPDTPDLEERLQEFSLQTGLPINELLARSMPPDVDRVLTNAGWTTETHTVRELADRYGRSLRLAVQIEDPRGTGDKVSDNHHGGFVVGSALASHPAR